MTNLNTRLRVGGASFLFLILGIALIPYAGVQNDEALFGVPYYQENARQFCITVFHKRIVLMVMSYIGTLKTGLYGPVFSIFGANAWSMRLPMVVTGALTVFLFYYLVQRSAGAAAALLGAFLLATDPSFLLTDTFDWGPVAIEHLCLVTGCLLVLRSAQESRDVNRSMRDLGLGFFFFGLGLWNKAIFGWALAGLAVATAVVFWPEVKRMASVRGATVAGLAFLFGALPFVTYNLRHPFDTLRQNAHREDPGLVLEKARMLKRTLDGSGLLGFLVAEDWSEQPKTPGSRLGRAAFWIRGEVGEHRESGMAYAFVLAILLIPWWWRSRAARFALLFMVVDWSIMIATRGAGGAVHHSVLLWPMPQFFIAATLGSAGRRVAAAVGVVLVLGNLVVINQYVYQFERNGAAGNFTDAIYPLSKSLADSPHPVYVMDWGMQNTLNVLHRGRLKLFTADFVFVAEHPGEFERNYITRMFSDPGAVFIDHVRPREVTAGARDGLDREAAKAGKREELLQSIADSNGRPVFEIFRLVPVTSGP